VLLNGDSIAAVDLLTLEQRNWGEFNDVWHSFAQSILMDKSKVFKRYREIYSFTLCASYTGVEERAENKVIDKHPFLIKWPQDPGDFREQAQRMMGYIDGAPAFAD